MSSEKIINTQEKTFISSLKSKVNDEQSSGRVDINVLLNRARKIKDKENLTNLVFIGLTLCLILIVGLILSF
tara:strand:+ start:456 stop:671 length:216 start_codon:yes stop_codon:yes gene_type:complete